MRARPLPRGFSSGELAPWVDGITNDLTKNGCRTLENFIVKKQGQAVRRPGSFFVNEVKDSSKATGLVPVSIDDTNTYVLEIGDAYIRFYKNHARVTYTGTTTIYEVTSPWSTGDLSSLRWAYSPGEKAILFANISGNYALQKLSWASDASWILGVDPVLSASKIVIQQQDGTIVSSEDGLSFKQESQSQIALNETSFVGITAGKSNLVSIGQTSSKIKLSSDDGESWSDVTPSGLSVPVDVHGNLLGQIVEVGGSGTINVSNDDGRTWTPASSTTTSVLWAVVSYDTTSNYWRVAGADKNAISYDAYTWTSIADISGTQQPFAMRSNGKDKWVAVGHAATANSGIMLVASSGTSLWVSAGSVATDGFAKGSLAYGEPDGNPLWLAVTTLYGWVYVSSTGDGFTRTATLTSFYHYQVEFIGNKFYIAAVEGGGGTHGTIYATTDGINFSTLDSSTLKKTIYAAGIAFLTKYEADWFNASNGYPKNLAYHEGRMAIGPTNDKPSTIWGSKIANFNNYYIGDTAERAFEYELTGEGNVDIQWFMGTNNGLLVGTRTAEGMLIGSPEEGITPLTAQFRWLSTFGSSNIRPVRIHDTIVFVQRGGEIIRGYQPVQGTWQSPDLTSFADHIADGGVVSLDRQDDPQSMVYAIRTDGQLLALTFDNNIRAWSRTKAAPSATGAATIESMAIIPTTSAEDEIWLIIKRTIGGSTKRYVEYMDTLAVASFTAAHYVDCGVYATSGTTFQTIGALTHLAGESIDAFISSPAANIRWIAAQVVPASGTINVAPYSGTAIHVGLPYSSYLQTLRSDYGFEHGSAAGINKKTTGLSLWVSDSSALAKFGPTTTTAVEAITYSDSTTLITEEIIYPFPGQYDRDNYIWCIVSDPRPFTLVAMLPDTETGDY